MIFIFKGRLFEKFGLDLNFRLTKGNNFNRFDNEFDALRTFNLISGAFHTKIPNIILPAFHESNPHILSAHMHTPFS